MAPLRHAPERTCVACRQAQPKRQLVRVVRTLADGVQVDPTGKLAGRGAYLCRQATCWELGLRKDSLARALKTAVTATDRAVLEAFAADLSPPARLGPGRAVLEGRET